MVRYFITLVGAIRPRTYLIAFAFMASACASLVDTVPASRLDVPEAAGKTTRIVAGVGLAPSHAVTLTNDASARPPDLSMTTTDVEGEIPFKVHMGLGRRFEVGLRGNVLMNTPWMLEGKLQFLGEPMVDAKAGNFSMAVTAAIGAGYTSKSGDQNGVFGPGGYNWNANVTTIDQDGALIAGYRFADHAMVFGGGFYSRYQISGNIHDDQSSDMTSPAADYSLSGGGTNVGENLGLMFDISPNAYIMLEADHSNFAWSNAVSREDYVVGGLLGVALR